MATALGISPRTWQDYEGGINLPGWKVLEGLAKLGFNINWILTGQGSMEQVVTITKETPEGFGRAKELTFKIYPHFGTRMKKELGTRTPEWLSEKSGLPLDTITGLLADEIMPSVDELVALSGALGVAEIWLAQGDIFSDTIKYVIGEVEDFFEKNYLHLPSKKKAELIWLLYEELSDDRIKKEELTFYVKRLLKFVS